MDDEQHALQALRAGDFDTAATLLKSVATAYRYSAPTINHAYTFALHKAGRQEELGTAALEIGNRLADSDRAAAMDYYQRAMCASVSAEQIRSVGEAHEKWAGSANRSSQAKIRRNRVAHVVGCLLDGHAPSLYLKILSKSFKDIGVETVIFTTEWAASWFFNPAGVPQSRQIDVEAQTVIASIDGNFEERAARVASAVRESRIDVVFFHNSLAEQITTRVAGLCPAPVQINVNHGNPVDADLFEGIVHLFENGVQRSRFPLRPWRHIPLVSDIEQRLAVSVPMTRQKLGLESAHTVTATFGNLYKTSGTGYLRVLARILQRFPGNIHVFVGSGDDVPIKQYLAAAGVGSQARFFGHMQDVAPVLGAIDLYLNSFPESGGQSVLEPMGAGKAVVIRRYEGLTHKNVGAELCGHPELIAGSDDEYIAIADRMLCSPELRRSFGTRLRERFQSHFRPERLAMQYAEFIENWR